MGALDGLRGALFLVVLSAHLQKWPGSVGGEAAMDVFFALSGFLITGLILAERQRTGRVSLWNFYCRRALRLLPALAFFLGSWLVVVALFPNSSWITTVPGVTSGGPEPFKVALEGVGVAFSYLTNWWDVYHLFTGYVPLGHLWSLAVEEQFYLLWAPLLLLLLAFRRRVAMPAIALLAGASLLEPVWLWSHGMTRLYFGTDTRAGALLLGCLAGMLWSRGSLRWLRGRVGATVTGASVAALVMSAFWLNDSGSPAHWYLGWIANAAGSAALVGGVVMRPASFTARLLDGRLLRYVGRRSYALYLWHYVWITWLHGLGVAGFPVIALLSFLSAEISWRLVETPALALKRRLEPAGRNRRPEARPEAPAAVTQVRPGVPAAVDPVAARVAG